MEKSRQAKKNCLSTDLKNMLSEFKMNQLNEESIYEYFSKFLRDADVESSIVVEVLEEFGEMGKEEALSIKINEGW